VVLQDGTGVLADVSYERRSPDGTSDDWSFRVMPRNSGFKTVGFPIADQTWARGLSGGDDVLFVGMVAFKIDNGLRVAGERRGFVNVIVSSADGRIEKP
jgi:hypothetical protein